MRVNILNNNVISIDFDTVDQVIDFIKKFNSSNNITSNGTDTIKIDPNDWKQPWNPYTITTLKINQPGIAYERIPDLDTYKVADPVPNPYTITATNIK